MDRVPTPRLRWSACEKIAECATVRLPLDYDRPQGPTVELVLLRVRARDPKRRIGSLFVNPGGPGAAGTEKALAAPSFLSRGVRDRFDVVGFDPRGIIDSAQPVSCFRSPAEKRTALAGLDDAFPYTPAEEQAAVASSRALGRACSTTGRPLSDSMSTTEVARDMDVLRRAVGDKKLTYLGFSYGTILGQYYANMFPDRVRAVAVDGVIDAAAWAGTAPTADQPTFDRARTAEGTDKAFRETLRRCARAGARRCPLAAHGDPMGSFDLVARRLRARPLQDGKLVTRYADFVATVAQYLYDRRGAAALARYIDGLRARVESRQAGAADPPVPADRLLDRDAEAFASVLCTDGLVPADAAQWPALAARADRRVPHFGRMWAWTDSGCAGRTWTARDEDAYRGPWNRRTAAPILVVGNYWDTATSYTGAVAASPWTCRPALDVTRPVLVSLLGTEPGRPVSPSALGAGNVPLGTSIGCRACLTCPRCRCEPAPTTTSTSCTASRRIWTAGRSAIRPNPDR